MQKQIGLQGEGHLGSICYHKIVATRRTFARWRSTIKKKFNLAEWNSKLQKVIQKARQNDDVSMTMWTSQIK